MTAETEDLETDDLFTDVSPGQRVFDADGQMLGQVKGVDQNGFYVRVDGDGGLTIERARDVFGKAYVMWRCFDCGYMGRLNGDSLPPECPDCGARREELYYWMED